MGVGPDLAVKVMGIGNAGCGFISRALESGLSGVECIAINTDAQALMMNSAPQRLRIGDKLTKGLGAGGTPEIGENAALESAEELRALLKGARVVVLAAGLGGGTGTGAAPVVARLAQEQEAFTVTFAWLPFTYEGARRRRIAEGGRKVLQRETDLLFTAPMDRTLQVVDKTSTIQQAFAVEAAVVVQLIQVLISLLTDRDLVGTDYTHIRSAVGARGSAFLGVGQANGEGRAAAAAQKAIVNPLLDVGLEETQRAIVYLQGGPDLTQDDCREALRVVRSAAPQADISFVAAIDPALADQITVSVLAVVPFESGSPSTTAAAPTQQSSGQPAGIELPRTTFDRSDLDIPAFLRRTSQSSSPESRPASPPPDTQAAAAPPQPEEGKVLELPTRPHNTDELDIPAFLRRPRPAPAEPSTAQQAPAQTAGTPAAQAASPAAGRGGLENAPPENKQPDASPESRGLLSWLRRPRPKSGDRT